MTKTGTDARLLLGNAGIGAADSWQLIRAAFSAHQVEFAEKLLRIKEGETETPLRFLCVHAFRQPRKSYGYICKISISNCPEVATLNYRGGLFFI